MDQTLFLCEKPSQAADIARVLGAEKKSNGYYEGNGYKVTWCTGHLVGQAEPAAYGDQFKLWNLESLPILPNKWIMEIKAKTKGQFAIIKSLVNQAQHIVIATDADREGELIGREILDLLRYNKRISRLWTTALDDASLTKALAKLKNGKDTEALYHAGLARSRADWIVGMTFTRAYSCKVDGKGCLSVGRVQTPTLALVVKRDYEIENFKSVNYFDITANFKVADGDYSAKWLPPSDESEQASEETDDSDDENSKPTKAWPRCYDAATADKVAKAVTGTTGVIIKEETLRKEQEAPLPFDMPSLQKYAGGKWGYSLQVTLDTAQALYATHKVTSYPRVECRYLPSSQLKDVHEIMTSIGEGNGDLMQLITKADITRVSPAWNDKIIESGTEAHHGIIPTTAIADLKKLSTEERNIYDAICRYYIAQFYPSYVYDSTIINTEVVGHLFRCSGAVPVNYGWKFIFGLTAQDNKTPILPAVKSGDDSLCVAAKVSAEKTAPPPRYTQVSLADDMKNIHRFVDDPATKAILRRTKGLGTSGTRNAIVENLFHKEYISGKKQIISTEKGRELIRIVDEYTPDLIDPVMTGKWELAFDRIASGALAEEKFTTAIKSWVTDLVNVLKASQDITMSNSKPNPLCPLCQGPTVSRKGKHGVFYGCKTYPSCNGIVNIESNYKPKKESTYAKK